MGTFDVKGRVEHIVRREKSVDLPQMLVDTGGEHFTIDEVVCAKDGDLPLLGARSLEGRNLTVDSRREKLVATGPFPAASAA